MQKLEHEGSATCIYDKETQVERIFTLILMAALVVIGVLFAGYSFRKVLKSVQPEYPLSVQCSLPNIAAQMPVYEAKPLSSEESLSLGMDIGKGAGAVYDSISYSHDSSSFIDSNADGGVHLLVVSNKNGTYSYRASKSLGVDWADFTRENVQESLALMNIRIPPNAEFASEGNGWHSFHVEEYTMEEGIVSGDLRCRVAGDGTVKIVENDLVTYSLTQYVETVSMDKILKSMERGDFFQTQEDPGTVQLVAAKLRYYPSERDICEPYVVFDLVFEGREEVSEIRVPLWNEKE